MNGAAAPPSCNGPSRDGRRQAAVPARELASLNATALRDAPLCPQTVQNSLDPQVMGLCLTCRSLER